MYDSDIAQNHRANEQLRYRAQQWLNGLAKECPNCDYRLSPKGKWGRSALVCGDLGNNGHDQDVMNPSDVTSVTMDRY